MVIQPLVGKIACVTGATRGIGKGIALQLGEAGATVYITGRTLKASATGMGSLEETANEIRNRGGKCIPVQVDHEDDAQIAGLFEKIKNEQDGRLDIMVNNAYKAVNTIIDNGALKFWEQKPEVWDDVNTVGLRNHYYCTVYAARLMVPRKSGLIVNISSYGGIKYLFNVPYGIGKAALDRMACDCGTELRKHNVHMISLYPGPVKTEIIEKKKQDGTSLKAAASFAKAESPEFSGKVIVKMAQDPQMKNYTARVILAAEYANRHGIKDIDNRVIYSFRELRYLLDVYALPTSLNFIAHYVPGFVRVPQFVIDIATSKF